MPVVFVSKDGKNNLPPRRESDFYPTAPWYADGLVKYMKNYIYTSLGQGYLIPPHLERDPLALDPGCGNDPVFAKAMARAFNAETIGVDIRPEVHDLASQQVDIYCHVDFTNIDRLISQDWVANGRRPDIITGNPPFSLAEAFVRTSMDILTDKGWLGFLLPVTFLASRGRSEGLFREFPPTMVVFLGSRPSFSNDGKTAPNEYCFIIWRKGHFECDTECDWLVINEPEEVKKTRKSRIKAEREKLLLEKAEKTTKGYFCPNCGQESCPIPQYEGGIEFKCERDACYVERYTCQDGTFTIIEVNHNFYYGADDDEYDMEYK